MELKRNISISNIPSCLNNRFYICWHSQEIYQYFAKYALDILLSVLNSSPYSYEFFSSIFYTTIQISNYLTASLENLENWKTIPTDPVSSSVGQNIINQINLHELVSRSNNLSHNAGGWCKKLSCICAINLSSVRRITLIASYLGIGLK